MDSQGRSNRAAWVSILPAGVVLLILCIVMVANRESNVWAIPTRPDPCAPAHPTTWPGGAVNRDLVQHQHRTADSLRFVNPHYKTYSAWDNSNYRYSAVGNARLADFGHGFMERPVKYKFVFGSMAFPAWARTLINTKVMPLWELKVNENLAVNLIRTKIKLEETLNNDEAFTIEFNTIYPLPSNIPPNGTFPDYDNIDEQGSYYPPGGPNPPPVPNGGGACGRS